MHFWPEMAKAFSACYLREYKIGAFLFDHPPSSQRGEGLNNGPLVIQHPPPMCNQPGAVLENAVFGFCDQWLMPYICFVLHMTEPENVS